MLPKMSTTKKRNTNKEHEQDYEHKRDNVLGTGAEYELDNDHGDTH